MGTWFVIGVKPTMFETTCSNAVEKYTWLTQKEDNHTTESHSHDIDINFSYNSKETPDSSLKKFLQKGWIQGEDKSNSALWKISPFWPIKAPYLILEVDEQCQDYTVIGYPNRAYCWIMGRQPQMSDATYDKLVTLLQEKHQYDLKGLRRVPQIWTAEEREKRGLTNVEIPDSMLVKNK